MFFIRIAFVVAHLLLWLSLIRIGMGLLVAFGTPDMVNNVAASQRYLAAANSGEAINEGLTYLFAALSLGVLAELGRAVVLGWRDHFDSLEVAEYDER